MLNKETPDFYFNVYYRPIAPKRVRTIIKDRYSDSKISKYRYHEKMRENVTSQKDTQTRSLTKQFRYKKKYG